MKQVPGPKGLEAYKYLNMFRLDQFQFWEKMIKNYGEIAFMSAAGLKIYVISNPKHIKYVFSENASNYRKSFLYNEIKHILGSGLLVNEGESWKRARRIVQPVFKKSNIASLVPIILESADESIQSIDSFNGKEFDVSDEMMKLTFQIAGRSFFGVNTISLSKQMNEALSASLEEVVDRIRSIIKIPLSIPTKRNRRLNWAINELDRIIYSMLNDRKNSKTESDDLLSKIIHAKDEETGIGLTDKEIRDEMLTFLAAGHETTSNALTWSLYLLSKNPEYAKKIKSEVDALNKSKLEFEDIAKLPLTGMVFEESLRLYSPAYSTDRSPIEDDEVDGYKIEKGSIVQVCIHHLHRSEKFWDKANDFIPERFSKENESKLIPFAFIPFGAGPRVCIGNQFANTEAVLLLAKLIQNFEPICNFTAEPEFDPVITLRPKGGMKLVMRRW